MQPPISLRMDRPDPNDNSRVDNPMGWIGLPNSSTHGRDNPFTGTTRPVVSIGLSGAQLDYNSAVGTEMAGR